MCAFYGGSVIHGDVAVGASVERAERLAALGRSAGAVNAGGVLCVRDRNGPTGAADGVAVQSSVLTVYHVNAAADIVCLLTSCRTSCRMTNRNSRSVVQSKEGRGGDWAVIVYNIGRNEQAIPLRFLYLKASSPAVRVVCQHAIYEQACVPVPSPARRREMVSPVPQASTL